MTELDERWEYVGAALVLARPGKCPGLVSVYGGSGRRQDLKSSDKNCALWLTECEMINTVPV